MSGCLFLPIAPPVTSVTERSRISAPELDVRSDSNTQSILHNKNKVHFVDCNGLCFIFILGWHNSINSVNKSMTNNNNILSINSMGALISIMGVLVTIV